MKKILSLFVSIISLSFQANALNYYWVNGTGNWSDYANHWAVSSGGNVFHVQAPTPSDDVFIDGNSFSNGDSLHIDINMANCHSMDWTGAANVSVDPGGQLDVYGSLKMTSSVIWNSPLIYFMSSSPGNVIDLTGFASAISHIHFYGSGSWEMQSDLNSIYFLIDTVATINLNGYTLSCTYFSNHGHLQMESSTMNCIYWYSDGSSNVDADSSFINCERTFSPGSNNHYNMVVAEEVDGGDFLEFKHLTVSEITEVTNSVFNNVVVQGSGQISNYSTIGNNSFAHVLVTSSNFLVRTKSAFDSLICNPYIIMNIYDTLFINSYLQLAGTCNTVAEIHGASQHSAIRIPTGPIILDHVLLQNISFTGGATFTANNCIDGGGVSGISINAPAPSTLYWVGGTGNWSDASHWSTVSGGPGGTCIPNPYADVFFDANSFVSSSDTVHFDLLNAYCKNMDWTGANNPFIDGGSLNVFGYLKFPSPVTWNAHGITFLSASSGNVVDLTGIPSNAPGLDFDGSGSWNLQSPLMLFSNSSVLIGVDAHLNLHGHSVNCSFMWVSGTLNMDTSTINCNTWVADTTAIIDADSSDIISTIRFDPGRNIHYDHVNTPKVTAGDSLEFNDLTVTDIIDITNSLFHEVFLQGNGTIVTTDVDPCNNLFIHLAVDGHGFVATSSVFDSIIFLSPVYSWNIWDTLQINSYLDFNGTCSALANIHGGTIIMPSGSTVLNNVILENISFTGGANFTANNSINDGSVSGITINPPTPSVRYWVGGSGRWSDTSHWSTQSGGPGGSCVPNPMDDVFIDSNSFTSTSDTLLMDVYNTFCRNLDFTGALNSKIFGKPYIYGSVKIPSPINWNNAELEFKSTSQGNTVDLTGIATRVRNLYFTGAGNWDLQNDLSFVYQGNMEVKSDATLNLNGHAVDCYYFFIEGRLNMGQSSVNCLSWLNNGISNNVDADSSFITTSLNFKPGSKIHYNSVNTSNFENGDSLKINDLTTEKIESITHSEFHNVVLQGNSSSIENYSFAPGDNHFSHVSVTSNYCDLQTNSVFDSLILFYPGLDLTIHDTVNIGRYFEINSTSSSSSSITGPGKIIFSDTVCADYIYLHNTTAVGGVFYAGAHSVDLGGNSGWLFSSCAPVINGVLPGDEILSEEAAIYPNPSDGIMKIQFKNNSGAKYSVLIYDTQGRAVMRSVTASDNFFLDRKNFVGGVYYITISNENSVYHGKIVFQ